MSQEGATPIAFADGAAYDRGMGQWSRLAGQLFLDWLDPAPGQRWIDIGCGSGAFTDLLLQRCSPASVMGIDPSPGQIGFARRLEGAGPARFEVGDAHALPYPDDGADFAVMALVIFFLADPAAGLAEARRVIRPGGRVAAYAWDLPARSFPLEPVQAGLRALGKIPAMPPSAAIATTDNLRAAWQQAGLVNLRQHTLAVTRRFGDFEEFWGATLGTGGLGQAVAQLPAADAEALKARVRDDLGADPDGGVHYASNAHAIVGTVPPD